MQAAPAEPRRSGLVGPDVVIGHVGQEGAGRRTRLAPAARVLVGEQGLQRHVEADHGGADAGAEHRVGGVGVLTDIGLGPGIDIPGDGQGPAHEDDVETLDQARILVQGRGEVGQRPGGDVDELLAVLPRGLDEEVDGVRGGGAPRGGRDVSLAEPIAAVDEGGDLLDGEVLGSGGVRQTRMHRHRASPQNVEDGQGIAHRILHEDIAVCGGDADELGLGAAERIGDREGVVDAGVQVEDQFLGHEGFSFIHHTKMPTMPADRRDTRIPDRSMRPTFLATRSLRSLSTSPLKQPMIMPSVPKFAKEVRKTVRTAWW